MSRAPSIKARVARWLLGLVVLQALLVVLPAAFLVYSSLEAEVSSLLEEEVAELASEVRLLNLDGNEDLSADLERFQAEYTDSHPQFPMALGLWLDGEHPIRVGPSAMVAVLPTRPAEFDERIDGPDRAAWRAQRLESGDVVAVAIDGSAQAQSLGSFGLLMLGLVLVVALLGLGLSYLIAGRVSDLVGGLSEGVRAMLTGERDLEADDPRLPAEVAPFVGDLRDGIEDLRRRTDRFRMMTAALAHELRSPLMNLIGETEVALMKARDPEADQALLTSNLDELRDLGEAIHNLLQLASEGDAEDGEAETFDLGEQAGMRIGADLARARRHGIEVQVRHEGDLRIEGDREGLVRAVRNLVGNAVAWSPEDGHIEVLLEGSGSELLVQVDDSGPGVPPELRESIFEPFFQGPSQTGKRAGYGLGLAMVRAAAESHGGSVAVSEGSLGGARFRLQLPRVKKPAAVR